MTPDKILYVDDEALALKYFERLVGPLAPVLTALSVEEGRAMLAVHGAEIAVLVCDQRMPGERGNALLRHARQHHPHIVRMLTTAYSELGEAIDAINTGEIYRYIAKPWALEPLRAELKNALELSALRCERDGLLRDKLLAQQGQLVAGRLGALLVAGAGVAEGSPERAVQRCAQALLAAGAGEPVVDWHRWDYADLQQAEARRGVAMVAHIRQWLRHWGPVPEGTAALQALQQAVGGDIRGAALYLSQPGAFSALFGVPAGQPPSPDDCAWPAWQLWTGGRYALGTAPDGWRLSLAPDEPLGRDWLASAIEQLRG